MQTPGDKPRGLFFLLSLLFQLAAATNTEPRSLYRLLRALASVGIFTEVSDILAVEE